MSRSAISDIVLDAYHKASERLGEGECASYIPALAAVDPRLLAVSVTLPDGRTYSAGDSKVRFTLQSISKVILLGVALSEAGFDKVFSRVRMEPSGDPFNSIVRLETVSPCPSNPMINAGAIAVTSCIPGASPAERFEKVLAFARRIMDNPQLDYDRETYASESSNSARNQALAYMMEATKVIPAPVSEHLEIYFKACSLLVNCEEISFLGAVLANDGVSPRSGERLLASRYVHTIRALMATCGLYDHSGEFAVRVGIPAKSGVGGGIMGAVPGKMGIGTFCPALDSKGNSVCGQRAMEYLSGALKLSVF